MKKVRRETPRQDRVSAGALVTAVVLFGIWLPSLIGPPASAAETRPSFDCSRTNDPVEKTICAEPRLATLDLHLNRIYQSALQTDPKDDDAVRREQRAWLARRNKACSATLEKPECIDGYYRSRIAQLRLEQRRRDEVAGQPPADETYSGIIGRWRVVGVQIGQESGAITNYTLDDPQYMGLELLAEPSRVRWLNNPNDHHLCESPSLLPKRDGLAQIPRWPRVTLNCKPGRWKDDDGQFGTFVLKSADQLEYVGEDDARLEMVRIPVNAPAPAPPQAYRVPQLPPGTKGDNTVTPSDKAYFRDLQAAVMRHDRRWVASHSFGGIKVNRQDGASWGYSPSEVLEVYDWIVTPKIEEAVITQNPDHLFKNWQGTMVGNGQLWFDQVWTGKQWSYTIVAINQ